jgi:hypothetical protein
MSDLYNDPNFRRDIERPQGSTWISLGALAAVLAMFVLIGMFAGSTDNQTATQAPAVETTGSGGGSTAPSLPR